MIPSAIDASIDVRWHGRGGQGVVLLSQIAGTAAFLGGRHVQVFPEFGVERRGAPVRAFLRLSNHPIRIRCAIVRPHVIVVLDPMLLAQAETCAGAGPETILVFNSRGGRWVVPPGLRAAFRVDATAIARRHGLGTPTTPIVNTAMAGAFARAAGYVSMEDVARAIARIIPAKPAENTLAAQEAFEETAECR
ncbi:MAG: 2-oxoacid:acceptor oxidoreductase family protein [Planctomycetes bacterium]|nr:2-oxoacid:acceptor oxidoreductase family protein [Planctomycetota bacterium]